MQDEGSRDLSSLKAFQNKSQVECFCILCFSNQKNEIWNKLSVSNLLVVYVLMYSHKDMNGNKLRIPTTKHFFKGESVKLSKG